MKNLFVLFFVCISFTVFSQAEFHPLKYAKGKFYYNSQIYNLRSIGGALDLTTEDALMYQKLKSVNTTKKVLAVSTLVTGVTSILYHHKANNPKNLGEAFIVSPMYAGIAYASSVIAIGTGIGFVVCTLNEKDLRSKWIKSVNENNSDKIELKLGVIPHSGNLGITMNF